MPDWKTGKRERGDGEWRLEPEGEAEVPEIIVVPDPVEGTFVDLDCESRHEQVEAKFSRRRKRDARSPKRKVFRVESEETHDYVREGKSTEHEEEEEDEDLRTERDKRSAKAFVSL